MIEGRQCHAVAVRAENLRFTDDALLVGGFALQRGANLDRFDLSLENPGEGSTDQSFEAPLESIGQTHEILLALWETH